MEVMAQRGSIHPLIGGTKDKKTPAPRASADKGRNFKGIRNDAGDGTDASVPSIRASPPIRGLRRLRRGESRAAKTLKAPTRLFPPRNGNPAGCRQRFQGEAITPPLPPHLSVFAFESMTQTVSSCLRGSEATASQRSPPPTHPHPFFV